MLGPKIENRMAELGIETQTALADKAGLSVQYVNALIRGKRGKRMGADAQIRLARALRVKPIFFALDSSDVEKRALNHTVVEGKGAGECPI